MHWSWFVIFLYESQMREGRYTSYLWNVLECLTLFLIILMHEFGHALGINGHSQEPGDVMVADLDEETKEAIVPPSRTDGRAAHESGSTVSRSYINTKLTVRDVNTVIRLYNCPGPLVRSK